MLALFTLFYTSQVVVFGDFFPSTVWGNKNLGLTKSASSILFGNVDAV